MHERRTSTRAPVAAPAGGGVREREGGTWPRCIHREYAPHAQTPHAMCPSEKIPMLKKPMEKKPTEKTPTLPTTPNETSPMEKKPMPSPLEQLMTPALAVPAEKYAADAGPACESHGWPGAAAPPPMMSSSSTASTAAMAPFAHVGRAPSAAASSSSSAPPSPTSLSLSSSGHGPLSSCERSARCHRRRGALTGRAAGHGAARSTQHTAQRLAHCLFEPWRPPGCPPWRARPAAAQRLCWFLRTPRRRRAAEAPRTTRQWCLAWCRCLPCEDAGFKKFVTLSRGAWT